MRKQQRLLVVERILDPDPPKGNPSDFLVDIHFLLNYDDAHLRSPRNTKSYYLQQVLGRFT